MNVKDAKIVFFGFGDVGYKCLKYLLEEEYNVEIPSEDLAQLNTVEDVIKYLNAKGVE